MINPDKDVEIARLLDAVESAFGQHYYVEAKTADGRQMYHHSFMSDGEEMAQILLDHGRITVDQLQVW